MRIRTMTLILSAALLTTVARANEQQASGQVPGTSEEVGLTSTAETAEVTRGYLNNEILAVKPQFGIASYTDQLGNIQGRAAYGFTLEGNFAKAIMGGSTPYYMGAVTGFVYSHLGDPGSNFWGSGSDTNVGGGGGNMYLIPANLKVGYNITDRFRLAAHGGGNVIYRSIASAMSMGDSSSVAGSVWRIFPNVGGDIEYAVGKNVALTLRPDWTFTPGSDLFSGMLAVNLNMG